MMIGQIVFVSDANLPHIDTGIITKRQRDPDAQYFWYEVFCNDGQNHVLPAFLLSPAGPRLHRNLQEYREIKQKMVQGCINFTHNQLNYIHNQSQNNNLIFTHK